MMLSLLRDKYILYIRGPFFFFTCAFEKNKLTLLYKRPTHIGWSFNLLLPANRGLSQQKKESTWIRRLG